MITKEKHGFKGKIRESIEIEQHLDNSSTKMMGCDLVNLGDRSSILSKIGPSSIFNEIPMKSSMLDYNEKPLLLFQHRAYLRDMHCMQSTSDVVSSWWITEFYPKHRFHKLFLHIDLPILNSITSVCETPQVSSHNMVSLVRDLYFLYSLLCHRRK